MRKTVMTSILLLATLWIFPIYPASAESSLINNVQMSLKAVENPKRLEVYFNLSESIYLSQGDSNIIFEYLSEDSSGNLIVIYKKDKTWSGYLNSYDNYPLGEHKYSSGSGNNTAYSNTVPATIIYTSLKTGASIDVTSVDAVRISVFRADGSGERVTAYSNGTISAIDKIEIPVSDIDTSTGIKLQSTTAALPVDTVLVTDEIASGPVLDTISTILSDTKDYIVFEIKLKSDGIEIQPDGKVKISIPIPEDFNSSRVAVYKIDGETRTPYPVSITANDGVTYATFETEHFSIYALAEILEIPQTGEISMIYICFTFTIICAIGMIVFLRKMKMLNRL